MGGTNSNRHLALRDVAFEKIRDLIVSGVFGPGERLIEESVGQRLGMSRNPVRESLKLLEREGFVTIHPFRGAVVSSLGRKQAMEVFEIREILDSFAARKAVTNATPQDVARLRGILHQGEKAIAAGNLSKLGTLNSRFHSKVYAMAANSELTRSLQQLRLKVEWMFAGYAATRGAAAWLEHQHLVDAIEAGNGDLAAKLSAEHVALSRIAYLDLLDQREAGADGDSAKQGSRATTSPKG